jgi:uncharacterized protein
VFYCNYEEWFMLSSVWIWVAGISFGVGAVLLVQAGNPGNYGFCAACHLRDIAGALGIHNAEMLQYARPEILGWIIGAFAMSKVSGEFRPRGGSEPAIRFLLGLFMMLGALVFLGCPLRSILRLAGGDLNGLTGLAGFMTGIGTGTFFLMNGFSLGRARTIQGRYSIAAYLPVLFAVLLAVGVSTGSSLLLYSTKGPGSQHAPVVISLIAGLVTGAIALKTRMCLSGGFRDYFLVKDTFLLKIYGLLFLSAMVANIFFGTFKLGFEGQPLAHTMHLWNFLGLYLVGVTATLLGGCPLRQIIMAADGNTDAWSCLLGMLAGAGLAHMINLAGSGAGVPVEGQFAVSLSIIIVFGIGMKFREMAPA